LRRFQLLSAVFAFGLLSPTGAYALVPQPRDLSPTNPCIQNPNALACVKGDGTGTLTGVGVGGRGPSGHKPPSGGGEPAAQSPTYLRYDYAPSCTGNTRLNPSALCGSAATSCQPPGTVVRATGAETAVQSPGTFCLGPTAPRIPPVAAISGLLARDLQRLIVLKGTADVRPAGTTLVNYPTQLSTTAAEYVLAPIHLLGHTVVVTAKPKQYDWYFGDGSSALDAGPGQAHASDVVHTYPTNGAVSPYVVITWTGTFTVDGGPSQAVFGTAQTTGPGTPLQVKQARAELVTK
jgi:hypothetical protein